MELFKGGTLDYKDGSVVLSALDGNLTLQLKAMALVGPMIDSMVSKIESGEIDLVKGTDIDKFVALQVLGLIKTELSK